MKQLRKRITYANVMSSIAVFLVLGGATAIAAGLAKNSVGPKQLKKNAVTTVKIKNNAVTGAKIKNGTVSGAKLNLGTIGKVPSAANADNANNANTANNANNANTVAGLTIRKFFYASGETASKTTLVSLNGLTLSGSCAGGEVQFLATTSVSDSQIHAGGTFLEAEGAPFYVEDDSFDIGNEENLVSVEPDSTQGTFTYTQPSGTVVTGTFATEEGGIATCVISGHLIG